MRVFIQSIKVEEFSTFGYLKLAVRTRRIASHRHVYLSLDMNVHRRRKCVAHSFVDPLGVQPVADIQATSYLPFAN